MDDNLEVMLSTYPNFKECTIQVFCDDKSKNDIRADKFSQKQKSRDEIKKLNDKWAWIFFSINTMKEWQRDKESVEKINAWACEIDGMDKELQRSLIDVAPLKPSLIIESKNSYHMYWFANDGIKENWNKICRGLRNFFNGDPAIASDISRVLRVPGFNHLKNRDEPFKCTICWWTKKYYTEEEMLQAYSDTMTISEKREQAQKKEEQFKKELWDDDFWERIKAMDTKTMILKLSWNWMVSYETFDFKKNSNGTEQIIVNWKVTGNWLDKNWKIWSTDRWWPHWTNRVFRYGLAEWKDVYQWIAKEFPMMIPERKPQKKIERVGKMQDVVDIPQYEYDSTSVAYKLADPIFDELGCMFKWDVVTLFAQGNSWKTTFALDICRRNEAEWHKCFYLNLEFALETTFESRWQSKHWLGKIEFTQISPEDKKAMKAYVDNEMSKIHHDTKKWINIDELLEKLLELKQEWYELVVIDSFSMIEWNTSGGSWQSQNKCMVELEHFAKQTWMVLLLIHHTNKQWKFSGSQKIYDLSKVVYAITRVDGEWLEWWRDYTCLKDKYGCMWKTLRIGYEWWRYITDEEPF